MLSSSKNSRPFITVLACVSLVACNTEISLNNHLSDTNGISGEGSDSSSPNGTNDLPEASTGLPGSGTGQNDDPSSSTSDGQDTTGGQGENTTGGDTSGGFMGDTSGGEDTGGDGGGFPLDDDGIITDPPGGSYAVAMALGWGANYILLNTGEVKAWGIGVYGQLGYGNTNDIFDPSKAGPIDLGFKAKQVVAGHYFACALAADGEPDEGCARCWGWDAAGNLGRGKSDAKNPNIGDNETPSSAPLIKVEAPIVKLVAGSSHACALMSNNKMTCWGAGGVGQLGYGDSQNVGDDELPSAKGTVDVGWPVADIAAGGSNTCALKADGTARCWGRLLESQADTWTNIGDDEVPSSQPLFDFGFKIKQLALGTEQICALATPEFDSVVRCVGTGSYAKLGYGGTKNQANPATAELVPLPIKPARIDSMHVHTCAVGELGDVACFGWGANGSLGLASTEDVGDDDTAMDWGTVKTGIEAVRVYVGINQTCALDKSSLMNCWGPIHGHPQHPGPVGDAETPVSVGLVTYN